MKGNEFIDVNLYRHPMATEEMRQELNKWMLETFFVGVTQVRVMSIHFDMSSCDLHAYKINDEGKRYVDPPGSNEPAMEWLHSDRLPPVELWDKFQELPKRFGE